MKPKNTTIRAAPPKIRVEIKVRDRGIRGSKQSDTCAGPAGAAVKYGTAGVRSPGSLGGRLYTLLSDLPREEEEEEEEDAGGEEASSSFSPLGNARV